MSGRLIPPRTLEFQCVSDEHVYQDDFEAYRTSRRTRCWRQRRRCRRSCETRGCRELVPVEFEPCRRLMRPVNRHHYMEGYSQVVSNDVDAAKGEKSCETESRASPSQGAADRGAVRVRFVGSVYGLRPDCGGPDAHGPWCSRRESHVRRNRRCAFRCAWSGGVDERRGLAAGGAGTALIRSVNHSCHPPPSNVWGGSVPDLESRQL